MGDAGLASLAGALQRGALPRLQALKLQCNVFSATGCAALGICMGRGALGGLKQLCMNDNTLGDAETFWAAMRPGVMANLVQLYWYSTGMGDAGLAAFARAISNGALPALRDLFLQENAFGDEGMEVHHPSKPPNPSLLSFPLRAARANRLPTTRLTTPATPSPAPHRLSTLWPCCHAQLPSHPTATPQQALSLALGRHALPSLGCLRLESNRFGDRGLAALALALRSGGLRSLHVLFLSGSDFGAVGCNVLTTALRVAARDPTAGGGMLPCLCNLVVPSDHARDLQLRAACDALGVQVQGGV